MKAYSLAPLMLLLASCGSSGGRPVSLDQGVSGDGGTCKAEGFVCAKASDCCAGLTCTNTVCTNAGGVTDMASKPKDFSMGSNKLVCGALLGCVNDCNGDSTCIQNCAAKAGQNAIGLFNNVLVCLFGDQQSGKSGACTDFNNGVCDTGAPNYNPTACDTCLTKAQGQGGACYNTLLLCLADCNIDSDCDQLTCGGGACTCQNGQCG